jgi:hypothetical protein
MNAFFGNHKREGAKFALFWMRNIKVLPRGSIKKEELKFLKGPKIGNFFTFFLRIILGPPFSVRAKFAPVWMKYKI